MLHHVDAAVRRDSIAHAFLNGERNERGRIDVAAKKPNVDTAVAEQARLFGGIDRHDALLVFEPLDRLDFRNRFDCGCRRCGWHLNPHYRCPMPAWPRQACSKLILGGICHAYADNRDCRGRSPGRAGSRRSQSDNGIDPTLYQFLRHRAELVRVAIGEFPVKCDILSFGIT
jgi:hypothetical protein